MKKSRIMKISSAIALFFISMGITLFATACKNPSTNESNISYEVSLDLGQLSMMIGDEDVVIATYTQVGDETLSFSL